MAMRKFKLKPKEDPAKPLRRVATMLADEDGRGLLYFSGGWPDEVDALAYASLTEDEPLLKVRALNYSRLRPPYLLIGIPSGLTLGSVQELDETGSAGFLGMFDSTPPSYQISLENKDIELLLQGVPAPRSRYSCELLDWNHTVLVEAHINLTGVGRSEGVSPSSPTNYLYGAIDVLYEDEQPACDLLLAVSSIVFAALRRAYGH